MLFRSPLRARPLAGECACPTSPTRDRSPSVPATGEPRISRKPATPPRSCRPRWSRTSRKPRLGRQPPALDRAAALRKESGRSPSSSVQRWCCTRRIRGCNSSSACNCKTRRQSRNQGTRWLVCASSSYGFAKPKNSGSKATEPFFWSSSMAFWANSGRIRFSRSGRASSKVFPIVFPSSLIRQ